MVIGVTPPPPTFSPSSGTYASAQTITLSDSTPGVSIYYTLDGSTPTFPATGTTQQYVGPFNLASSATVKAIAVGRGFAQSTVAVASYSINALVYQSVTLPAFTPGTSYSQPTVGYVTGGTPPYGPFTFESSTGTYTWFVSATGVISSTPVGVNYTTVGGTAYTTVGGTPYFT